MDAGAANSLSHRELAVAELVAGGATNQEVASKLHVSPKTVEAHLSHIYRKLDVRSRTELAVALLRSGVLSVEQGKE